MIISRQLRQKINKDLAKFCSRWRDSAEFRSLIDILDTKYGMSFLITGYPHKSASGSKSWNVSYEINGEEVENSLLVVSMFESPFDDSDKKEYNLYVS